MSAPQGSSNRQVDEKKHKDYQSEMAESPAPSATGQERTETPRATQNEGGHSVNFEPVDSPSQRDIENAILEEERRQDRLAFYENIWFWVVIIPLFIFTTVAIYWILTPGPRQQPQSVVVQLPDNAGMISVTPARNPWETPRVVAVYNAPRPRATKTKIITVVKEGEKKPTKTCKEVKQKKEKKIIKREIPKED